MRLGCGVDRACDACACAPSLLLRCSRLDAETFLSHTHLPSSLSCLQVEFSVVWGEGRCRASDSPSLCTLSLSASLTLTWIWQIVYSSDKPAHAGPRNSIYRIGRWRWPESRLFLAKGAAVVIGNKPFSDRALFPPICPKPPKSHANLLKLAKVSTCKLMKSQQ